MAEDAQKRIDAANQKAADASPGNVVSQVSAFGTPSTYEDENHPDGKAVAQLDKERTQDLDKFKDDSASIQKSADAVVEERVKAAENAANVAEANATVDEAAVTKQQVEAQQARESASNAASRDRENATK